MHKKTLARYILYMSTIAVAFFFSAAISGLLLFLIPLVIPSKILNNYNDPPALFFLLYVGPRIFKHLVILPVLWFFLHTNRYESKMRAMVASLGSCVLFLLLTFLSNIILYKIHVSLLQAKAVFADISAIYLCCAVYYAIIKPKMKKKNILVPTIQTTT